MFRIKIRTLVGETFYWGPTKDNPNSVLIVNKLSEDGISYVAYNFILEQMETEGTSVELTMSWKTYKSLISGGFWFKIEEEKSNENNS